MTDLDLDEIERLHPDEPGINPFVRPLVAEVRRLRNIGSPFGIDRTLDEFRDHLAADLAGPGVRPYVDEMFSALVARTNERDEARAEAQRATAWHMEALDDLARAVRSLDTSKAIASERRARVNRLIEAVERERAERLALTALLNAKQAWIDGAKVDLDGYDSARAERDAYLAALGAIASMPSASIAVRDVARHALLNGGNR